MIPKAPARLTVAASRPSATRSIGASRMGCSTASSFVRRVASDMTGVLWEAFAAQIPILVPLAQSSGTGGRHSPNAELVGLSFLTLAVRFGDRFQVGGLGGRSAARW